MNKNSARNPIWHPPAESELPTVFSHHRFLVFWPMEITRSPSGPCPEAKLLAFLALVALVAVLWLEFTQIRQPLLLGGEPKFGALYSFRTLLIAAGSWFFVCAIVQQSRGRVATAPWRSVWSQWGSLRWTSAEAPTHEYGRMSVRQLVVWGMVFLGLGLVLLFLARPIFFSRIGREDRPVETLSAALHLLNAGMFTLLARRQFESSRTRGSLLPWAALALAALFFLIGMEEISWLQRTLALPAPQVFAANVQGELRLHNFNTSLTENVYYFLFYLLLIVFPFLTDSGILRSRNSVMQLYAPSRFVIAAGALFVAYNYDMWNILLTQVAFFTTLFILVHYVREAREPEDGRAVLISVLAVFVLSQGVFLLFGYRFVRVWDVTEYKELLIPLACAFYALGVLHRYSTGRFLAGSAGDSQITTPEIRRAWRSRATAG